jgi:beta-glucosidase
MAQKLAHSIPVNKEEIPAYRDASLSVDERVADLLDRMTIEEKVAQMICIWGQKKNRILDEQGKFNPDKARVHLEDGIGQVGRLSDTAGGLTAAGMAELANTVQRYLVEETRLGIPAFFHEECLHGLAARDATSYPVPIGLASTFNPELVEQIYTSVAEDARRRGAHQALTPVVDVARDPRWGRVEETFGEDPFLVARMGVAAVKGFQGDGKFADKTRIVATLKHFAAHGQPESGMNCAPANVSERLLRDVFLYPFREAVQKGKCLSVMASYNEIDGVPSHANTWLLRDVLRKEWGFEGYVVSDYYAITELNRKDDTSSHAVAKDKADAAILAVKAGVNIELPDPDCYPNLLQLARQGAVTQAALDELIAPLLKYKFILGLFEDPYIDVRQVPGEEKLNADRQLALRAARETITLLKNDGDLLPLSTKDCGTLAVIGPNADRILLGGYSGKPRFYTTVLEGIRQKVGDKVQVLYSEGCKITVGGSWNEDCVTRSDVAEDRKLIKEAVAVARKANTVILALGGNEQTSREGWSRTHLGDRPDLELVGLQVELVRAILETGKRVIVILFHGRPNAIPFIQANVPSILECWYLGQETGLAVADVLFGDFNPSGKLPMSIPRSAGHVPCYYNYKPSARRGYLFDDANPLWTFGHGLSYTTFRISNLRLERSTITTSESTTAMVDVTNTGTREGEEVVQMYIRDVVSSVTRPVKELRGFSKIGLKPGETVTVALRISPEHLSFTNIDKKLVVEPGDFEIMVGSSSGDADRSTITLQVILSPFSEHTVQTHDEEKSVQASPHAGAAAIGSAFGKLSVREKIGYGFGDAAANFVFQTMLIFQLGFYTDVFGITAVAAGTLLLVGRVWDAAFDPLMGVIADRTNTKWGKFRPWVLWMAVPFAAMFFLAFTTPDFGSTGKLIYAYVTYLLLMMVYSANNLPYSALNGVITGDVNERTSLSSYRFFFAMAAAFVVQGLTLPMVSKFGQGNAAHGWSMTVAIFAGLSIVFFVITFLSVKERIMPDPNQKTSPRQDFADLLKNRPWISMFTLTLFLFITLALWGSATFYYFTYYVDKDSLFSTLQSWGLVSSTGGVPAQGGWWHDMLNAFGLIATEDRSNVTSVGFSLFNMSGQLVMILGVLASKALSVRFGKRAVFITGLSFTTLFTALFITLPADAVGFTFILNILKSLAYGPTIPLLWAMMADVADFAEWKTHRRATGVVFAGIVFALKAGLGFGGAICGWLLAAYGYIPNVIQSEHALFGIRMTASIFPAITFFVGVGALIFYGIDKTMNLQIQHELEDRRKGFAQ